MSKHLWDVKHPYHCEEGNYHFAPNANLHRTYDSFRHFLGDWATGEDHDMNLLFRWDWIKETETDPDELYFRSGAGKGKDRLMLFYVMQRRGYNMSVAVAVRDEDEAFVRAYLEEKALKTRDLWEPLLDMTVSEELDALI